MVPNDERKVLEAVVWPVATALLVFSVSMVLLGSVPWVAPLVSVGTALLLLASVRLARSGRSVLGGDLALLALLASSLLVVALFGGVRGALTVSLPLVVLLGGALRGTQGAAWAAGLAVAGATVIALDEATGRPPALLPELQLLPAWLALATSMFIAVMLLRLIVQSLEDAHLAAAASARSAAQNERRMTELFEHIPDGIILLRLDGTVESANPAVFRMYGLRPDEILDVNVTSLRGIPDEAQRERVAAALKEAASGKEVLREFLLRKKDGGPLHVEANTRLVNRADGAQRLQVVLRDLTERRVAEAAQRTAERRLERVQRLESVGRLAGGVAHDYRNLLTAIIGNAELLRYKGLDAEQARRVDEIVEAAERGTDLTTQLLAFARREPGPRRPIHADIALRRLEPLLRRLVPTPVALEIRAAPDLPQVELDPGQLDQILLNLVTNARDARARHIEVSLEPGPGGSVALAVRDDGDGMDEVVRAQAFDPFFTTKPPGEGTGLGLAAVHGIVDQAGGHVDVESAPGAGSTFRVVLPPAAVDAVRRTPGPAAHVGEVAARAAEVGPRVLVVDDEPLVRRAAMLALRGLGLRVDQAADAEQALAFADREEGPPDVLVTDVIMPGTTGPELAARLRERRPDLGVVFISGFTRGAALELDARTAFVQKPFWSAELVEQVYAVLGQPRAAVAPARGSAPAES